MLHLALNSSSSPTYGSSSSDRSGELSIKVTIVLQDWHEAGSLLQREGSLPPVFVSSHVQPTMDRPLQVPLTLMLTLTLILIGTVVLTLTLTV